jgi:hypothetical protein
MLIIDVNSVLESLYRVIVGDVTEFRRYTLHEGGGNIYLRNVDNIAHILTV